MSLQDVKVTIDIRQPSALIGLGIPVILVKDATVTEPEYKEFSTLTEANDLLGIDSIGAKYVGKIFGQGDTRPNKVAVLRYATSPAQALEKYFYRDFFFVLLAEGEIEDHLAVSDIVEAQGLKMAVFSTDLMEDLDRFKQKNYDRTIVFYHNNLDELPDAALIGSVGSRPVGSVTWKFKTLAGVTPQEFSAGQLDEIHRQGGITYVTKSGINQTSEGIVSSGEYIDVVHAKDWVRINIESSVQKLLSTSDKIPFTDAGIAQVESAVTNVLKTGYANGIIAQDSDGLPSYEVTALGRSEVSEIDRKTRKYNGLEFAFELAGAIHEAKMRGEVLI